MKIVNEAIIFKVHNLNVILPPPIILSGILHPSNASVLGLIVRISDDSNSSEIKIEIIYY